MGLGPSIAVGGSAAGDRRGGVARPVGIVTLSYLVRCGVAADRWSAPALRRISDARSRVGRMFSRRLRPLIVVQMPSAVARASSS